MAPEMTSSAAPQPSAIAPEMNSETTSESAKISKAIIISKKTFTEEDVITPFSCRPPKMFLNVLQPPDPPKSSVLKRSITSSPPNSLDKFPVEILHLAFNELDCQSLSRLSRTSVRFAAIVQSMTSFSHMMRYAPTALAALGSSHVVPLHPIRKLHAALLSEKCVACGEYGPLLFVVDCVRCCCDCHHSNQTLWAIAPATAVSCFGLSWDQVQALPTIWDTISGYDYHHFDSDGHGPDRTYFVGLRAARQLFVETHGSGDAVIQKVISRSTRRVSGLRLAACRFLHQTASDPAKQVCRNLDDASNYKYYANSGLVCIPLPSFSPETGVENGLWCRGCEWMDLHGPPTRRERRIAKYQYPGKLVVKRR